MQNKGILEIDLHGKNIYQTRITVNAALKNSRGVYIIRLIHGYNNGQAIKDMIYEEYCGNPFVLKLRPGSNPGITELVLREF